MADVLGFVGAVGAGKDTAVDVLEAAGYRRIAFADELRREVSRAFGVPVEFLTARATKELPSPLLALCNCADPAFVRRVLEVEGVADEDAKGLAMAASRSPRRIQQLWGTEYRRAQDEDYWVRKVERLIAAGGKWAVSDVRMENEIQLVQRYGAVFEVVMEGGLNAIDPAGAGHLSEALVGTGRFPVLRNVFGDMSVLQRSVRALTVEDAEVSVP